MEEIKEKENEVNQSSPDKKKKIIKIVIIAVIIAVYTALVSFASIELYKKHLEKEIEDSIEDAFSNIDFSVDDNTQEKEKDAKKSAKKVKLNEQFSVENVLDVTLEKCEWLDEILPSKAKESDWYSSIEDIESEKYFVVRGKITNNAGKEIYLPNNSKCTLNVNGKYDVEGDLRVEETDGAGFDYNIKPLQTLNVILYISVSDEMYKQFESANVYISLVNSEEGIDKYDTDSWKTFSLEIKK